MKLIPIWAQAAIVAVIVSVIFGAGWKTASWKASGKIEKETARRVAAELAVTECQEAMTVCTDDLAQVKINLTAMKTARDGLSAAYDEAVSRPPEVVIRYRDRWHEASDVIVSPECPSAVGQLVEYLHTLPAVGGAHE